MTNWKIEKGNPRELGVTCKKGGINFCVAVSGTKKCSLVLYKKGKKAIEAEIPFPEEFKTGDVFAVRLLDLDYTNYEYNYRIDDKIEVDCYARELSGRGKWALPKVIRQLKGVFAFEDYDWEGDVNPRLSFEDTILYGMHVRGFTCDISSGVSADKRGTYAGIQEKIPYLKELGVNQIELMPAYEFDEIIEKSVNSAFHKKESKTEFNINYWGYGTGYYFAPKASYAAGTDPVREFKNLVKQLHLNHIELILEFYFPEGTNPGLIIDCIRYWVLEYHIDGVHITGDLAGVLGIASNPLFSKTKIMCSGNIVDEISRNKSRPEFRHLAQYDDGFLYDMRKYLKGDEDILSEAVYRMRKNSDRYGVVNYITHHNGFTLLDLVSYESRHNELNREENRDGTAYNFSWNCGAEGKSRKKSIIELRKKQMKNALLLLLMSQGVPFILSGDEHANSQNGNNNAYCQDNKTGWVNWNADISYQGITEFMKRLIAFRKRHPIFHKPEEFKIQDYLSCGYPDLSYHGKKAWCPEFENDNRQIGILYCGKYSKIDQHTEDNFFYVVYNTHWIEHQVDLPKLPKKMMWRVAIDTDAADFGGVYEDGEERILDDQKTIAIKPRTIIVLIGK